MFKPDHPTADNGQYTEGNISQGIPATIVKADHLNAITNELSHIIEQAGISLDKADSTQLRQAVQNMIGNPILMSSLVQAVTPGNSGNVASTQAIVDYVASQIPPFPDWNVIVGKGIGTDFAGIDTGHLLSDKEADFTLHIALNFANTKGSTIVVKGIKSKQGLWLASGVLTMGVDNTSLVNYSEVNHIIGNWDAGNAITFNQLGTTITVYTQPFGGNTSFVVQTGGTSTSATISYTGRFR